ncbi:hypothetical protein PROFUN_14039 [Planoprotostelium fungivorum]|uniref:3',5'-cyclic-GMP phosphodiesterase n=1 Tax=Planoprotostelium fungivorum TaxID=1890364 RepID=A0A2P6N293_9EUKA|nr:hypothetical protein PROFUN_14039 [Planoprotostelium fungivorum]
MNYEESSSKEKIEEAFHALNWDLSLKAVLDALKNHDAVAYSSECARIFLGLLAIKSSIRLPLTEITQTEVAQLMEEETVNRGSDDNDTFAQNGGQIPRAWVLPSHLDFFISIYNVPSISAIQFENCFYQIRLCLEKTTTLIEALLSKEPEPMREFEKWISSPTTTEPYVDGHVRLKETQTFVYDTIMGPVQIGIPPETIKTSLRNREDVPQYYVLPPLLFAEDINFGEVEFPIFFNFFIKQAFKDPSKKVYVVGNASHLERVKTVFKESIFGPDPNQTFVNQEISGERKQFGYTIQMDKERDALAHKNKDGSSAKLTDFANFLPFDENGIATITKDLEDGQKQELKIANLDGLIRFYENGKYTAAVDTNIYQSRGHQSEKKEVAQLPECTFEPPTFGVTFLGTSHGFDKNGNTTGFIIWINGRGIVVDPPVQTTDYLHSQGIKTSIVDKVILTHCHSDHDSGIIRKIITGEKIELYTTKTVHESYVRKMNASTGLNITDYYHFIPVSIGLPMPIAGALFEFDYSFHTIPTVRFKVSYAGQSISYSSDTFYDPKTFSDLRERKVISPEREISLRMFVFDADLIIHESGVPPIHTSIATLNELPRSIKKKMVVVHCAQIPPTVEKELMNGKKVTVPVTDLRIPECGLDQSIRLPVPPFEEGYCLASRRFKLISEVFLFRKVSPPTLYSLYTDFRLVIVPAGHVIITAKTRSDSFFIIERGTVTVSDEETGETTATLRGGDAFGENALRMARLIPRAANVIAKTETHLLTMTAETFRNIIQRDELQESRIDYDIEKITRNREFVRSVLSETYLFKDVNTEQINAIAAMLEEPRIFSKDSILIKEGDRDASLFLIKQGSVRLERMGEDGTPRILLTLGVGEMFGEVTVLTGLPRTASVYANEDQTVVLELKKHSFKRLMSIHQNLRVKMALQVEQRMKEAVKVEEELKSPLVRSLSGKLLSGQNVSPRNSQNGLLK